ncbi:hypothetical protein ABEB36_006204 [Hypothenemus hampei]|uniref:Transketolase-like pyrimidine-binding domain-containing protein n=1 Tax=Hypothenemus hampei TaxID=57062 RepID=A0ABD1EPQ7_HYPHA
MHFHGLLKNRLFLWGKNKDFIRFYWSDNVFGYKKYPNIKFKLPDKSVQNQQENSNLYRLVSAYRKYGHQYSYINPVRTNQTNFSIEDADELNIHRYGFDNLEQPIEINEGIINQLKGHVILRDLIEFLNNVYCTYLSAEFDYLESEEERVWFAEQLETDLPILNLSSKLAIVRELIKSQVFDQFLAKRFSSVKRYGAEGAESMSVFFNELFHQAAGSNIRDLVLALPHRGRLNLLVGLLNYPAAQLFSRLNGNPDFPEKYQCSGDVLSHIISSTDLYYDGKSTLHVTTLRNPSHLEAVNPVSMGKSRAKHLFNHEAGYGDGARWGERILNVQVHGDAAFTGQGVNQECFEFSGIPHFEIGGTIHLIVNNQLGFTTPGKLGRSSRYCSDLAKIIAAPVVHVNGDHPEKVVRAAQIALNYQRKFRKDVVVDLNCFRRWGHNEMDDPTFTNPNIYVLIKARRSVPDRYASQLIEEGVLSENEILEIQNEYFTWLNEELEASKIWIPKDVYFKGPWSGFGPAPAAITTWDTGIDVDLMTFVGEKSVKYPDNFNVHSTILRGHVKNRLAKVSEGLNIDWSTAEALAIGSLLFQGHNVRISGQDVGRGTFSQRHAMFVDQGDGHVFVPLNHLHEHQRGFLELANSILSEEAVLAFEYGMSIESPNDLFIWEAQFGDFFNGAQIVFDTFISSGEAKWIYQSGLTVLLPHGYDGAGPEHSSCRIERFLQLTDSNEDKVDGDNVNMQICQPSTPAQYFHLLRRQVLRDYRKPLIVVTPKTLLRDSECISHFSDMTKGNYFKPVLGDYSIMEPTRVKRVLITSGKHYYSLKKQLTERQDEVAIIRIECFCPFPTYELLQEITQYKNAQNFVWCQEEPQNMGAWTFIKRRFENLIGKKINYCGRQCQAAPAVGVSALHKQQELELLNKPFSI